MKKFLLLYIIILISLNLFSNNSLAPKTFFGGIYINSKGEKIIVSKEGDKFLLKEEQKEMYGMVLSKITIYNNEERVGYVHFRQEGKRLVLNTMISNSWSFVPSFAIYVEPKYKKEFNNIGKSLMSIALSIGAENGAESCSIYNIVEYENAEIFYNKIGFSVNNENAFKQIEKSMLYPEITICRKQSTNISNFKMHTDSIILKSFIDAGA